MHSGTLWNILHALWNILEHSGTYWNILEQDVVEGCRKVDFQVDDRQTDRQTDGHSLL